MPIKFALYFLCAFTVLSAGKCQKVPDVRKAVRTPDRPSTGPKDSRDKTPEPGANNASEITNSDRDKEVTSDNTENMQEIFTAVSTGSIEELEEYFKQENADPNLKNERVLNKRLLHFAASNGHKEIAELLIEKGANVNAENNRKATPLHVAASRGQMEVAEFLITKGASVHAVTSQGETPLDIADIIDNNAIIRMLSKKGARRNMLQQRFSYNDS